MMPIRDTDVEFALKIIDEGAYSHCVPDCFFGEKKDICPKDWRPWMPSYWTLKQNKEGTGRHIVIWVLDSPGVKELLEELENCPLLSLRNQLEDESPLLFGQLKKFCQEIALEYSHDSLAARAERIRFLAKFLLGFLAIYSVRRGSIPNITERIFSAVREEEQLNQKAFVRAVEKELRALNPKLYKVLLERLKNCRYSAERKRKLFSLFKAVLEGIKKNHIGIDNKEIFKEVERILKEAREGDTGRERNNMV